MGKRLAGKRMRLPVTEDVAATLVRMPIYAGMSKTEREYVVLTAQKTLQAL
jgi:dTDP-4-amino-4,6-dideoxygalactose transaminase